MHPINLFQPKTYGSYFYLNWIDSAPWRLEQCPWITGIYSWQTNFTPASGLSGCNIGISFRAWGCNLNWCFIKQAIVYLLLVRNKVMIANATTFTNINVVREAQWSAQQIFKLVFCFSISILLMHLLFRNSGYRYGPNDEAASAATSRKSPSWNWWYDEYSKSFATLDYRWCSFADHWTEKQWWKSWISSWKSHPKPIQAVSFQAV